MKANVATTPLKASWSPCDRPIMDRLGKVLASWEGTPYMEGQAVKGVGTNCVCFICATLNELYRWPQILPERIPADAQLHNKATALAALKNILRSYPEAVQVPLRVLEPGDIIVTRPAKGGPGHGMLVGPDPFTLWHCQGSVHRTTWGYLDVHVIHNTYRCLDRHKWAQKSS